MLEWFTITTTNSSVLKREHVIEQEFEQRLLLHARVASDGEVFGNLLHAALTTVLEEGIHPVFSDAVECAIGGYLSESDIVQWTNQQLFSSSSR